MKQKLKEKVEKNKKSEKMKNAKKSEKDNAEIKDKIKMIQEQLILLNKTIIEKEVERSDDEENSEKEVEEKP